MIIYDVGTCCKSPHLEKSHKKGKLNFSLILPS